MADNVVVTQGLGKTVLADEVVDGTLGTGVAQFVKIMDGALDSSNKLSVSAGGAMKVDGSAVTQPVSGTVTVQQSTASNLKVDLSGTAANTTALKVDGSAVTQPVSGTVSAAQSGTWNINNISGTISLPTGAATAAKQPALGTAGTASTDVITVQGIASMTALKVDGSGVTQPVSGTVAATQSGNWSVRLQDGSGNAITSDVRGSARPLAVEILDGSGNQITSFGGSGGTASNFTSAFPASGTAAGFSDGTNMQGARVFDADSGAGTQYILGALLKKPASGGSVDFGTSSDPVIVAGGGTAGAADAKVLTIQGIASMTAVQVSQATAGNLNATVVGTGTFAVQAAQSGTWSVRTQDGSGNLLTSTARGSQRPLDISVLDGSGTQITAFNDLSGFGSAMPASGVPLGAYDGTNLIRLKGDETNGLWVNIKAGAGSGGTSATDEAAFTAGTSAFTSGGGFFQTTATNNALTTGQWGAFQVTANRALFSNLRNAAGTEVGTSTTPLQVSLANTGANGTAVKVDGSAVTQPVSGTVTANQGTAAAVTAGWPVISGQPADTTGTFTNATQATSVTASSVNGYETVLVSINGTFGTATAIFELSDDGGTTWYTVQGVRTDSSTIESGYSSLTNTTRAWVIPIYGADQFRVRSTAVASGTVNVRISPTSNSVGQVVSLATGSNIIGALSANQSVNLVQANGTTVDTNSGTKTAGTIRVVLATDQPQLTNKLLVTPDANSAVNVAQMNGVTVLMGAGNTGTGSQRVTIATDQAAIATHGHGATGASVPANATMAGARAQNAEATAVTNGQLVALAADLVGKLISLPYANPENQLTGTVTSAMTGTSDTDVTGMGAQGAGVRVYITSITVSNAHATVGTEVVIKDGAGGTVLWTGPAAPAFGGVHAVFPVPLKTTANTKVSVACLTTGTSTKVSLTGYKGA